MGAKRKLKTMRRVIVSILVVAIVAFAGAWLLWPKPLFYESAVAAKGNITTYNSFSGNIDTKKRQTVMSEKMLQVSKIKVQEGDAVKVGTALIRTTAGEDIKSKIVGEIATIHTEVNAQVMAGTNLMDIVDYNNLEITVKVDEYDIGAMEKGKDAAVSIGAIGKELSGKISSMSKEGQVKNGITYFTATIDLAADAALKIGMTAEVKLVSGNVADVVTLPMTAIAFDDDNKPFVLKKDGKGAMVKSEITTGINDGITAEIKSGVLNGETVYYKKTVPSVGAKFPGGGA
ncbi:MAG: HlyD family efflux transporter periplasmic adaptor subunit [Bacteroidia bacterium]|nr:HlyD family efflux transporter periplasmic adaptor subunit [Bacteroidia bacterium]